MIRREFHRHAYLLDGDLLLSHEKKSFNALLNKEATKGELEESLFLLSELLSRYHGTNVIVLIDEYDTPIHAAYTYGYYHEDMLSFVRSLYTTVLKDNPFLKIAFVTGILRLAKENIFSGLNNLNVFTFMREGMCDKFGFTSLEIESLLKDADLEAQKPMMTSWYNGYRCGSNMLYNPWSFLKSVEEKVFKPFWVNTSDNLLIQKLIGTADDIAKSEFLTLLNKGTVVVTIDEGLVFPAIKDSRTALWSLLLFSGYVTYTEHVISDKGKDICILTIPNKEIYSLYEDLINALFQVALKKSKIEELLHALTAGKITVFESLLNEFIVNSMSSFDIPSDEPERSYHLFVLGLLVQLSGSYKITSNRESGHGRYDILMMPLEKSLPGIVIEFKKADKDLESAAQRALEQIEKKNYVQTLIDSGINDILRYGIGIKGKEALVKLLK